MILKILTLVLCCVVEHILKRRTMYPRLLADAFGQTIIKLRLTLFGDFRFAVGSAYGFLLYDYLSDKTVYSKVNQLPQGESGVSATASHKLHHHVKALNNPLIHQYWLFVFQLEVVFHLEQNYFMTETL